MKAAVEVEAPASGTIYQNQLLGSTVPVGETIATIFETGEVISNDLAPVTSHEIRKQPIQKKEKKRERPILASPLAKKLAKTHQINLQYVKDSFNRLEKNYGRSHAS
jgi:pyruvate/2-oxoglutarate dehydrogenase complex dihydrolipoamide acyltransferase (E2) component